jgi:hypothetical protein
MSLLVDYWGPRHGYDGCCARGTGHSSLELRPPDAPRQTNVSRTKRRASSPSDRAFADSVFPAPPSAALSVPALMVAALLAAAMPTAHGQDATPAGGQSANPSSPAAPAPGGANKGAQASTDAGQAGGAQQTADSSTQANGTGSGKRPPVCFKLTGRCVELSKTPAGKGTAKDDAAAKRPLNLAAPDVRTVVPADELKEPLPSSEQVAEVQEDQTVSIKGEGVPADVPLGFGAIWWALNHPSQAWRIVTPVE